MKARRITREAQPYPRRGRITDVGDGSVILHGIGSLVERASGEDGLDVDEAYATSHVLHAIASDLDALTANPRAIATRARAS